MFIRKLIKILLVIIVITISSKVGTQNQVLLVSDPGTPIEEGGVAVETWIHPLWDTSLIDPSTNTTWIWSSFFTTEEERTMPTENFGGHPTTHKTFVETFTIPSNAASLNGIIRLAADNMYEVLLNGIQIAFSFNIRSFEIVSEHSFVPQIGVNTIKIIPYQLAIGGNEFSNPAGAIYRIEISFSTEPPCDPIEPPEQRTQGFWRRQCKNKPHEDICTLVDSVHILTDHFDGFDCGDVCDLMNVSPPENDMCRKAERQFMALLLNIASGKLSTCNCIIDGRRVEDVISEIESLLMNSPDHATCVMAKTLADDVNTGASLKDCGSRTLKESNSDERRKILFSTPNPFSKRTIIRYAVSKPKERDPDQKIVGGPEERVNVTLRIYDVTGRLIRVLVDEKREPGEHKTSWNGLNETGERAKSGIYFYRMTAGSSHKTGKITLIN